MNQRVFCSIGALSLAASLAGADIGYSTSHTARFGGGNIATFDNLAEGDSLVGYTENGIVVDVFGSSFQWDAPGMGGSSLYYADTGALSQVAISLESGISFSSIEMQISSGWNIGSRGTEFVWVQVFDDKDLVIEFDIDMISGGVLSLSGDQSFDTVLIGAYASDAIRDSHNPWARNAIALDDIRINGEARIPAPSSLALGALGILGASRRRR